MNLLVVSNLFPDQREPWRGLDNATLVHALLKLDPGLNIRVQAFRPSLRHLGRASPPLKPRAEDAGLAVDYFWTPYVPRLGGMNHRLFAHAFAKAQKTLPREFVPQAILVPWLFPDACGVALAASGVPVVAVAQGSDVHRYLDMPWRRRAILAMTRRVKAVVTRSQDLASRLVAQGADAGKVQAVYNGVDVHTFKPASRSAARSELQVSQDERVLLFVGNFLPVKGLDLLLAAFAQLVATFAQPLRLALIGGGPLEEALRAQAAELDITEKVSFLGRHGAAQVARWMQAADAVCLTSHNEGVPNVVLESMASGRAPVCIDVGGIGEVVEPVLGKRFLVRERDAAAYAAALRDVLEDPPDEMMLQQAMTSFSWENCAQKYLALLRP